MKDANRVGSWRNRLRRAWQILWIGAVNPGPPPLPGGDWTEDAHYENGQYMNRCAICGGTFVGHKRRVVCRHCSTRKAQ